MALDERSTALLQRQLENYFRDIPAGEILLRDDRIGRHWHEKIAAFQLASYPVNQAFYQLVMGHNPSTFKGDDLPVENITWQEAIQFCNRLSTLQNRVPCYVESESDYIFNAEANGFRLPTEAEWQYACQAGNTAVRYGSLDEIAWYKSNSQERTHPIGLKKANAWELHDMLGNVWEWCSDIYDEEVYGSYRIIRGGGWADEARGILATNRRRSHPKSFKIDDLGFRIALNKD